MRRPSACGGVRHTDSPIRGRRLARAGAALLLAAASLAPLSATAATPTASSTPTPPNVTDLRIPVRAEPDGTAVTLDATIRTPGDGARHPAVILAHGFGGSKDDLVTQAEALVGRGYVVATFTDRGFGASGGRIHLMDPDYEVADARTVIDTLTARSDVQLDAPGDPRVGIAGGSYGGALALMTAGADRRVDAIVPSITWHDLADALFPQSARGVAAPGPFKQMWASNFFNGAVGSTLDRGRNVTDASMCGRFAPDVCRAFLPAANDGTPSAALLAILHRHSPAPTNAQVKAPTLLIQGETDSLFPLAQADATRAQLAAAGTPVAMRWTDGGHDQASATSAADDDATAAWFGRYLTDAGRAAGGEAVPAFGYAGVAPRGGQNPPLYTAPSYPGLSANPTTLPFAATTARRFTSPPGAEPAATIELPGVGSALAQIGALGYRLAAMPDASAAWDTAPAAESARVVGAPTVRLRVTSSAADATFYVSLWQVTGANVALPHRLSAPVKVATTPGRPTDVTVALPADVYRLEAGSRWRVLVTSTQSAYASPRDARAYEVAPIGGLVLPTAPADATTAGDAGPAWLDRETIGLLVGLAALLVGLGVAGLVVRRRRRAPERATDDRVLVVDHLVKTYRDGHRAVDDVSFEARAGQVVGLLGPNGAGKTTTLRMVLGLIRPASGSVRVLGEPVAPGAPVLARVGALVEGPGFLPHLSGRANLAAYWAATGRPADEAHLAEALDVAALGDAIERPVRSYSQGMRQRLGIAQAMLGLPDVLILDEPANGLDPPQIAAMRPVLRAYAATGRTVIVSSHLLSEVEETCSHVVVMDRGRVVVTGAIDELTTGADGGHRRLEDVFLDVIARSQDRGTDEAQGEEMDVDAVVERLRKVRSR